MKGTLFLFLLFSFFAMKTVKADEKTINSRLIECSFTSEFSGVILKEWFSFNRR